MYDAIIPFAVMVVVSASLLLQLIFERKWHKQTREQLQASFGNVDALLKVIESYKRTVKQYEDAVTGYKIAVETSERTIDGYKALCAQKDQTYDTLMGALEKYKQCLAQNGIRY